MSRNIENKQKKERYINKFPKENSVEKYSLESCIYLETVSCGNSVFVHFLSSFIPL